MKTNQQNRIQNLSRSLLIVAILIIQAGCASMIRGGSEKVMINSQPSGAEVKLSTGQYGVTPIEFELKRKDTVYVTISKEGFKDVETALISSIDGGSLAAGTVVNFLFIPGVNDYVDYKIGANYSHKPNPLFVKLIPSNSDEDYQMVDPKELLATSSEQDDKEVTDVGDQ